MRISFTRFAFVISTLFVLGISCTKELTDDIFDFEESFFSLESSVDRTEIDLGESANFTIEVKEINIASEYTLTFSSNEAGTFRFNGDTFRSGQSISIEPGGHNITYIPDSEAIHRVSFTVTNTNDTPLLEKDDFNINVGNVPELNNDFTLAVSVTEDEILLGDTITITLNIVTSVEVPEDTEYIIDFESSSNGVFAFEDDTFINREEVIIEGNQLILEFTPEELGEYDLKFSAVNAIPGSLSNCGSAIINVIGDGTDSILVETIVIVPQEFDLVIGETQQLNVNTTPEDATNTVLEWSSSNINIATVDENGLVTAITTGAFTITSITTDGSLIENVVTGQVQEGSVVPATGITLVNDAFSLMLNATQTIQYSVDPSEATNQEVQFVSSDPSVVSVDEVGVVTANAIGEAIITLSIEGETISETVTISVVDQEIPVESITIISASTAIEIEDTLQLATGFTPANSTNTNVVWSSSDETIATVNDAGLVTGVNEGTATITVTIEDGSRVDDIEITVNPGVILVDEITIDNAVTSLLVDQEETFTVTISPTNATNNAVIWRSSNPSIATVDDNGVVTALSPGDTTITVETTDGSSLEESVEVTVQSTDVPVTGITLVNDTFSLMLGATQAIQYSIEPIEATNQEVQFVSSNPSIVSVDEAGVVTANAIGEAIITLSIEGEAISETITITVEDQEIPVESIAIISASPVIEIEDTLQLATGFTPANSTNTNVVWSSSDETIATVNDAGLVTGVSVGTATITVTTEDGSQTDDIEITVNPGVILVDEITIDNVVTSLMVDQEETFTVTISPTNATNSAVIWSSSNPNVASVDTNGLVTALSPGETTITVETTDGSNLENSVDITLEDQEPIISFDQSTLILTAPAGSLVDIRFILRGNEVDTGNSFVRVFDASGNELGEAEIEWDFSSNNGSNSPQTDSFLMPASGQAFFSISHNADEGAQGSSRASISVDGEFIANIETNEESTGGPTDTTAPIITLNGESSLTLLIGDTFIDPGATAVDNVDGDITSRIVIGGDELDTSTAGTYRLTYNVSDSSNNPALELTRTITVNAPENNDPDAIITVSPTTGTTDTIFVFTSTSIDPDGDDLTYSWTFEGIEFSDLEEVSRTFEAGMHTITLDIDDGNGASDSASVTITVIPVEILIESITVEPDNLNLEVRETEDLTITILPVDVTNTNVSWSSSDETIATVDANGLVMAVGPGSTTINVLAEDGSGVTTSIPIMIDTLDVAVTGVSISPTAVTLEIGETESLTANIEPSDATDQSVTWVSSDTSKVIIDTSGNIIGVSSGSSVITVTTNSGDRTSFILVTVNEAIIPVTQIVIDPSADDIAVNQTIQFTVEIQPTGATNQNVTWESSNESIATVDSNGLVTTISTGDVNITVVSQEDSSISSIASLTVLPQVIPVTQIVIDPSADDIAVNETIQFTVEFLPMDTTNQNVTWESSDENIATVDLNGLVTTINSGEVDITVISQEDSSINSTASLTVLEPVISVTGLGTISTPSDDIFISETLQISVPVLPVDATNMTIIWSTSDEDLATIDSGGLLTGVSGGLVRIIATSEENPAITVSTSILVNANRPPVADISTNVIRGEAPLTVNFDGSGSTDPDGDTLIYSWSEDSALINFSSTDREPSFTFTQEGEYEIELQVSDGNGGSDVVIVAIFVEEAITPVTQIFIDPSADDIAVNETIQFTVEIQPIGATNQNVTWESSNENIATVDSNGLVTTISSGDVNITVVSQEDSSINSTARLTVEDPIIPVIGVTINGASNITLEDGDSTTLTATVSPSDAADSRITWSSSNTRVVSVSSTGRITAQSEGTATITVTTDDGAETDSVRVTVEPEIIPIESITITGRGILTIDETDAPQTLSITILPANATDRSVTWSSSNTSIVTVTNGGVIEPGTVLQETATVTVRSNNDPTIFDTILIDVNPQ